MVVQISCRQLSSKMPQLVLNHCCLVGREVRCQTSFKHSKRSGSHAAVPLITRGPEQKKPETQRTTAQRLSANLAVNVVTPQLTSKNNIEPQTKVARHPAIPVSIVRLSRAIPFKLLYLLTTDLTQRSSPEGSLVHALDEIVTTTPPLVACCPQHLYLLLLGLIFFEVVL